MKDSPSLHDHLIEFSSTGSTFAAPAGFGLRLMRRRFGAGAFGLAFAVVSLAPCASAPVVANSIVVENAPMTVAISSFFMESRPFEYQLNGARPRGGQPPELNCTRSDSAQRTLFSLI